MPGITRAGLAALLSFGIASCHPGERAVRFPRQRPIAPLFDPAAAPALLDDPGRNRWQKPEELVRALALRPGDRVADIGAGSGYLLPYLSRAVGREGIVYAEEIQEEFLPALRRRARELGNVRVVLGTDRDPRLPSASVDCFVLLTVYHEVQDPVGFLRGLHRFARPHSRLAIVDFDASRRGQPPAPDGHSVWEKDVIAEAREAGWTLAERHELFSSQFFLIFRRPAGPPSGTGNRKPRAMSQPPVEARSRDAGSLGTAVREL